MSNPTFTQWSESKARENNSASYKAINESWAIVLFVLGAGIVVLNYFY